MVVAQNEERQIGCFAFIETVQVELYRVVVVFVANLVTAADMYAGVTLGQGAFFNNSVHLAGSLITQTKYHREQRAENLLEAPNGHGSHRDRVWLVREQRIEYGSRSPNIAMAIKVYFDIRNVCQIRTKREEIVVPAMLAAICEFTRVDDQLHIMRHAVQNGPGNRGDLREEAPVPEAVSENAPRPFVLLLEPSE